MLKYVGYFCRVLSVLSFIGGVVIAESSPAPLFYIIAGAFVSLLWIAAAIILTELAKMQEHIYFQTRQIKRRNKRVKSSG